jgi:hypothetical protein
METRRNLLLPLLFMLASCGETEPEPDSAIAGSFVAANPWPNAPGFHLGLSLNVIGETVSGQGWLSGTGDPLTPITIVGQFTNPEFALGVSAGSTAMGTITGTANANGTLTGTYQMSGGTAPVTIVFVPQDSGAVGRYNGTTTGEFTGSLAAAAGFGVSQGRFFLRLAFPNRSTALLELGRVGTRPATGTYQLGDNAFLSGDVVMGVTGQTERTFRVQSGQIRVDISTPYALIGELLLQAEEAETRAGVGLSLLFSAGCMMSTCQ